MTIATLERSQIITLLDIPYQSQRDNRKDPHRTCNSTACFTAMQAIKPGIWASDCDYIDELYYNYGDTIDHSAHDRMLAAKGVESRFYRDLDYIDLSNSLKKGKPVVIGILHKGYYKNPTGGHMITVVGQYDDGFIAHDPYGYPCNGFHDKNRSGANVLFSYKSLNYRWLVEGKNSGWGRIFL